MTSENVMLVDTSSGEPSARTEATNGNMIPVIRACLKRLALSKVNAFDCGSIPDSRTIGLSAKES